MNKQPDWLTATEVQLATTGHDLLHTIHVWLALAYHWLMARDWVLFGTQHHEARISFILFAWFVYVLVVAPCLRLILWALKRLGGGLLALGAPFINLVPRLWPYLGFQPLDALLLLPFIALLAMTAVAEYPHPDWPWVLGTLTLICLLLYATLLATLNALRFRWDRNKIFLGLKATQPRTLLFPQLRLTPKGHLLSLAPTGSGKGRGLILPNLLDLPHWSVLVIDPKGENALVSARWRRCQGHDIVIFNPYALYAEDFARRGFTSFQSFNPLANLDSTSKRFVGDVDNLTEALIYESGGDSHWVSRARGLVAFLIKYLVAEPAEPKTLRRLRAIIQGGYPALAGILSRAGESPLAEVREAVSSYKDSNTELLSVIATVEGQTGLFTDEAICSALDGSGFDFGHMKHHSMSVYLILPSDYLQSRARYLRLILNAALAQFMRTPRGRYPVLVILDEFAGLGALTMVKNGFGQIRSYGVTLWPFLQDLPQLQNLYPKDWGTFQSNAAAVTVSNVNDTITLEHFIQRAGKAWRKQTTLTQGTHTKTGATEPEGQNQSQTTREEFLHTLDPEELYEGGKSMFLFLSGAMRPVKAAKPFYDRYIYKSRADRNPAL